MIIRKPYAFLIKNFKKIHIFLLILSFYVAYKLIDINSFVGDFMKFSIYDSYRDPVTKHISFFLMLSIFLLFLGSISLLFLLFHKKKPWKIYLIPTVEYFSLIIVLSIIKSFFKGYTIGLEATDIRFSRDLLVIFLIVQVPCMAIFVMRIFGLDINKFEFNSDKEFLELSDADREEFEIGLDIDRNSFIRGYKRFLRNFSYFYEEHKKICKTFVIVVVVLFVYNLFHFIFITNRVYSQGDYYSANGYTFKVNNVYFTDKDYNGNIISDKSNFVIVDLTIKNNSSPREVYLENFHLRASNMDYVTTKKTFSKEFQDLGSTYDTVKTLNRDEVLNCIIVYKVDRNLKKNRFNLYYQENGGYLRKIKLKVKDISKIENAETFALQDELQLEFKKNSETILFEYVEFVDNITYFTKNCKSLECVMEKNQFTVENDYKILKIDFASDTFEAKNMIDFLKNYGKLKYKDSNGIENVLEFDNPIRKTYYGKTVFLKVPVELSNAKSVSIDLVVRNKHYIYNII